LEPETPQLQSTNDPYQRADADAASCKNQIQVLRSDSRPGRHTTVGLAKHFGVITPEKLTNQEIERDKVPYRSFPKTSKVEFGAKDGACSQ